MRFLIGATYLVISSALLMLLVDGGASGLALLARGTVWLIGIVGPLFCADFTGRGLQSGVQRWAVPVLEWGGG
jgi:hypothetical protein